MAQIILEEGAAPDTPSSGQIAVYAKADGVLYFKDDTGAESSTRGVEQSGTFTGTLTGFSGTAPSATVSYFIVSGVATIAFPTMSGTSNSTSMTMTGLPSAVFPTTYQTDVSIFVIDSSGAEQGIIRINTDGTVLFYRAVFAAFTASGLKGIRTSTVSYPL